MCGREQGPAGLCHTGRCQGVSTQTLVLAKHQAPSVMENQGNTRKWQAASRRGGSPELHLLNVLTVSSPWTAKAEPPTATVWLLFRSFGKRGEAHGCQQQGLADGACSAGVLPVSSGHLRRRQPCFSPCVTTHAVRLSNSPTALAESLRVISRIFQNESPCPSDKRRRRDSAE